MSTSEVSDVGYVYGVNLVGDEAVITVVGESEDLVLILRASKYEQFCWIPRECIRRAPRRSL